MGAARGLKKAPVESPECLRCHATGWNLTEEQKAEFLKPAFKIEDGVQCETCHGPGEKYRTLTVMKDRQAAVKAGLILGDEKLCRTCHNDQSPAWKPDRYTTKDGKKVGFDYAGCWEKIKHPVPKEPAQISVHDMEYAAGILEDAPLRGREGGAGNPSKNEANR